MKEQLNFYADLPSNIRNQLNEIYPRCKSDMQFFLQNTEPYHDLYEWVFERKNYNHNFLNLLNNKYKISAKDANTLRKAITKNTKIIFLNQSVWAKGKEYRQIHFSKNTIKTGHPRIYIRPLKIYLTK